MDKFSETVDLSKKIRNPRANAQKFVQNQNQNKIKKEFPARKIISEEKIGAVTKSNVLLRGKRKDEIDELFRDKSTVNKSRETLQNIDRPKEIESENSFYKQMAVFLVIALVGVIAYFLFFSNKNQAIVDEPYVGTGWYSIKLVDEKIYYGQIDDTKSEPILIRNVYYDYDQLRQEETETGVKKETGSLRLVKRGKETHGPSGDMEVFREKVLLMEPLREESKVLKAILEYEK